MLMIFSARITLTRLADLCGRLATALEAGIDMRAVWARESERAAGAARRRYAIVAEGVARGESLYDALAPTGSYFPELFRELAQVGEKTGHRAEVFGQLADHYRQQLSLRRTFLLAIAWPLIQLGLAIVIIGFLIWVMGIIRDMTGNKELDPLGFGLVGNKGLMIYLGFLAAVGMVLFVAIETLRRGWVWSRPIQRGVMRVPVLGQALLTMALARLAWTMHLTMKTGMDVRQAINLSVRSTRNARYLDQIDRIDASLAEGNSLYEAFFHAASFPADFLDALAVGEQSGKLDESMATLAGQYRDRARAAMVTLTMLAGVAVWILIALILVALIFRLFFVGWYGPYKKLLDSM